MNKKAEQILENFKKEINLVSCEMDKMDAAGFFSELADWAYANSEAMTIDDDLDIPEEE